jgi:hypothetical protein
MSQYSASLQFPQGWVIWLLHQGVRQIISEVESSSSSSSSSSLLRDEDDDDDKEDLEDFSVSFFFFWSFFAFRFPSHLSQI